MSAPQIIRTPGGEELVVLPLADYEALLDRADHKAEDADGVAIYDARKTELAAGGVVLPPEVSAAILRGDSRLKAIRHWREETQLHLAFKTDIGQGYLSDLENGRRTGTPETLGKLAQALDVPVEWFFIGLLHAATSFEPVLGISRKPIRGPRRKRGCSSSSSVAGRFADCTLWYDTARRVLRGRGTSL